MPALKNSTSTVRGSELDRGKVTLHVSLAYRVKILHALFIFISINYEFFEPALHSCTDRYQLNGPSLAKPIKVRRWPRDDAQGQSQCAQSPSYSRFCNSRKKIINTLIRLLRQNQNYISCEFDLCDKLISRNQILLTLECMLWP